MTEADPLRVILSSCDRLRRIPEGRWYRPPEPPLGARIPGRSTTAHAATQEEQVRHAITLLMEADARERRVAAFVPQVPVFALPDVLGVCARSLAERAPNAAALRDVAATAAHW